MDFRTDSTVLWARILALVSLLIGLGDAAGVLGVGNGGGVSPWASPAAGSFVVLAGLSVARLFAAVGLWIHMRWGAVVLLVSLAVELALSLTGSSWIGLSLWNFIFKLATLLATIGLLGFSQLLVRRQIAD